MKSIQIKMSYSIYIPRVSGKFSQEMMMSVFYQYALGQVKRIDLVAKENSSLNSAFVHFHFLFESEFAKNVIHNLEQENGSYKLQIFEGGEYWILLKNKNPIEDTVLNIHQLADITKKLEEKMKEQEEQIRLLQELINNSSFKTPEKSPSRLEEVPDAPIKQRSFYVI